MKCPACSVDLVMTERQGTEIDYCPKCRGVWLDRGELDKIIEKSTAAEAPRAASRGYEEDRRPPEHGGRADDSAGTPLVGGLTGQPTGNRQRDDARHWLRTGIDTDVVQAKPEIRTHPGDGRVGKKPAFDLERRIVAIDADGVDGKPAELLVEQLPNRRM